MSDMIAERVIKTIAEAQHIPPETISIDSTFDDLKIDSLSAMSIVFELENEFDISIPNEEVLMIRNVRQVVESLRKILPEEAADAGA